MSFKPGYICEVGGRPAVSWWRYGVAALGEASTVSEVRVYESVQQQLSVFLPDESPAGGETFSFRAEHRLDIDELLEALGEAGVAVQIWTRPAFDGFPDLDAEIRLDASESRLRSVLKGLDDVHVISETLRPCALAENSLERDPNLGMAYEQSGLPMKF